MKNMLKKIIAVVACIIMLLQLNACSLKTEDVNSIVDNAFKNYQTMNSTESGAYSNFKDINVQSSYLGYGYDVINDPYMGARYVNTTYPILDLNKIDNVSLLMEKENHGNYEEFDKSTIEEFYQDYATAINVYGKVGKCFSGGLKLDFSGSQNEKTYFRFYKLNYYYDAFYISITNTVEQLRDYLSESFNNDLKTLPIEDLFNKYGTHLIKEASMGGRIEKSVTYTSNSTSTKSEMDAAVNAHIKAFGVSINTEVSKNVNQVLEQAGVTCTTKVSQLGGKAISLSGEVNYEKWAESFDESLEYAALCGVKNRNSLIGIWELLPNGYETRAKEIENKFIELCDNEYFSLCNNFKLTGEVVPDNSWNDITVNMERKCTKDNSGYSVNKLETNPDLYNAHNGFELGELKLYGCEEFNNQYIIKKESDLSIKYHLMQNYKDLPVPNEYKEWANTYIGLLSDTANSVEGTNISSPIGYGAYWVRITYSNDEQVESNKTNIFENVGKDSYIEILNSSNLDTRKRIKKIEIVVVYEIWIEGNAFLWWREDCTNWRCEYVFNF